MAQLLILGYGNPLRSDDSVGWKLAEQLWQTISSARVEVLALHQLTPELAEPLSRAEAVFFVDASCDGEPGELTSKPVLPKSGPVQFSHELSPEAILGLAWQLYGACPQAFAFTLSGEWFDHGERLSPKVALSLTHLTSLIRQIANHITH